jgi:hypothetical protein
LKDQVEYEVVEGWDKLPEGWVYTQVAGVSVDTKDRVYVLNRGEHPIIVYEKDGSFIGSWGGTPTGPTSTRRITSTASNGTATSSGSSPRTGSSY